MDWIEYILLWLKQGRILCQFYMIFIWLKIFAEVKLNEENE